MIRITEAVRDIVLTDGYVIEGMQKGIINLSSYAQTIHKTVEKKCMKPVKIGSIVVTLTRLSEELHKKELAPQIQIDSFSVTSRLCEISYDKITTTHSPLTSLHTQLEKTGEFFTITQGMHEITIVCSEQLKDSVITSIGLSPKATMSSLVALSIRFSDDYLTIPNTIYSLVRILALRHINIVEIVSTYTELSFVIEKSELKNAIDALESYSSQE